MAVHFLENFSPDTKRKSRRHALCWRLPVLSIRLVIERFVWRVADQLYGVARWVVDVDAFGSVAVRINGLSGFGGGVLERAFIHAKRDVHRVLRGRYQSQLALSDAQKGPCRVLVENFGGKVLGIKGDAFGDVARFERDVIHFKHGLK